MLANRLNEAEAVLAGSILTKQRNLEELCAEFGDSASYALRLLGRVYRCELQKRRTNTHSDPSWLLKLRFLQVLSVLQQNGPVAQGIGNVQEKPETKPVSLVLVRVSLPFR